MTFIAPVITIDGPSGAGKSTICKALAEKLQWHLLDSGAFYRVLALTALQHQIALESEQALVHLAVNLDVHFEVKLGQLNVLLEKENVNHIIRNEMVGNTASQIASFSCIRDVLLQRQYAFRTLPGLIAEGRDMGTVVFPDAPVKIFLNASLEERAQRRMQQLQENGFSVNFKHLLFEVKKRDDRDCNRAVAPLVPAADALVLDSTYLTINELIFQILTQARKILALS